VRGNFGFAVVLLAFTVGFATPGSAAETSGAKFAGEPIAPGATVRANVPLSAIERSYVSEGGNAVPDHAVAVLAVPPGFNPQRSWPVLVCISTSDFTRQNRDDLRDFYRDSAFAEGWVLIAGDGEKPPQHDAAGWRAGMTLAALDALHRSFPGSNKWPVACAGFSGGAKRAGTLTPLLSVAGLQICGIFLTGINEDRLSQGYRTFKPGPGFLRTPVYLGVGQQDRVATVQQQSAVKQSLQRTGFQRVRLEFFPDGHAVKRTQVREALHWFRELL
jgi:hypothetical protein